MKHVGDPHTPDGEQIRTRNVDGIALVTELEVGEVVHSHDGVSDVIDESQL